MINWQKALVIELVVCIGLLPCGDLAALVGQAPLEPAQVKKQVRLLGVGAEVKLRLADGRKLHGSISAVEGEAFLLASGRAASPKRVSYDQVGELKLAKLTYRATGQPDPTEARRVVAGLGARRHITVRTADGKEYHGLIVAIEDGSFTLMPDRQTASVQIAYNEVQQLGPNLSRNAKIGIIVGAAAAAIVIIFFIWLEYSD